MTPVRRPYRAGSLNLQRLRYNLELPHALRGADFDLVVGFDLDGFLSRPRSSRYVVALKGILADEAGYEAAWTRLRLHALSLLEWRNAGQADRVFVTSEYCRVVAGAAYGIPDDKISIVPEGLDMEFWRCRHRPARDGSPRILNVARQYPRKNTRSLLHALPAVRDRWPDVRLRVVGEGPELPALRALARELRLERHVRFLGKVASIRELRAEYARADLFCMPSLQEGFGIVFLEAMAMELPIVAAAAGAVPEVVPAGAGLLVDGRYPHALSAALLELLDDPAKRARMGRVGRDVAAGFSWPLVAELFLRDAIPRGGLVAVPSARQRS